MPMPLAFGSQATGLGGQSNVPTLDSAPPHTAPRPAGADTNSLMGSASGGDISMGAIANSPLVRVISGIASLMDGVNQIQAILGPSAISPQFLMEIQQMQQTLPAAAKQMQQTPSAMGMMQSAAALAPGGGIGQGPNSGLPMMPSLGQSAGMSGPPSPTPTR